ncbi:hypothetical protein [uncultured Sphingomonas sp.]|uniref:hypothetical protein n=1 Tax=uncultured Sphingomonas sp. TaxID=158754 RepID=UPI0035CA44AD
MLLMVHCNGTQAIRERDNLIMRSAGWHVPIQDQASGLSHRMMPSHQGAVAVEGDDLGQRIELENGMVSDDAAALMQRQGGLASRWSKSLAVSFFDSRGRLISS